MNFGILTFHRAHNYGAMLQAIALREILAETGNKVYFIDYWPKAHKEEYKIFNKRIFSQLSFLRKLNYIRKFIRDYKAKKKRITIFERFFNHYILPFTVNGENMDFDAIFYGSDQIWRKRPERGDNFDKTYFAINDFVSKRHISYAASMGIIYDTHEDIDFLRKSLQRFSHIGVREQDLKNFIEKTGIVDVRLNIDPTFLLPKEKWCELLRVNLHKEKKYILFYDLMYGSFDIDAVKEFADAKGLELIVLKARIDRNNYGVKTISYAGPKEFVELIANAEYVFTSSFHGLAFSIIFQRQFFASYRQNSDRAATILAALGLSDRLVPSGIDEIPQLQKINYSEVQPTLESLILDSEQYIKEAISSIPKTSLS